MCLQPNTTLGVFYGGPSHWEGLKSVKIEGDIFPFENKKVRPRVSVSRRREGHHGSTINQKGTREPQFAGRGRKEKHFEKAGGRRGGHRKKSGTTSGRTHTTPSTKDTPQQEVPEGATPRILPAKKSYQIRKEKEHRDLSQGKQHVFIESRKEKWRILRQVIPQRKGWVGGGKKN